MPILSGLPIKPFGKILLAIVAMLAAVPGTAAAAEWPERPITILLPFAGGGMMDFTVRAIAQDLGKALGQTVVIEPKAGGAGVVATIATANAAPDGYTLLISANGPLVFRPLMTKSDGPDPAKSLTPIVMVGDTPNVILASPKLGVGTVKELVAYAGKHQNRLTIGHPGVGTMGQFCGMLFAAKTDIDGTLVGYRGAAPIITDLRGGQIDIGTPAFGPGTDAVKVLAVAGDKRLKSLPEVPTLKESGVDMQCATWLAIYGPPGLPRPIVDKLNGAIGAFLRKPETDQLFSRVGLTPLGGSPERLRDRAIADTALWGPIVAKSLAK
jgi:tripartite-type tricarboxylate transporter receptor subunit TctC